MTRRRSAFLAVTAQREVILARGDFNEWIVNHIDRSLLSPGGLAWNRTDEISHSGRRLISNLLRLCFPQKVRSKNLTLIWRPVRAPSACGDIGGVFQSESVSSFVRTPTTGK